jgi:glucose-1-phosphate thymidylyltransferase
VVAPGEHVVKGIVLAGGSGSRLRPLTLVTNKHLLPVYDKPMIYWPLDTILRAGIRDVFVVTGGDHFDAIGALLGSGDAEDLEALGLQGPANFSYGVQKKPAGIAHALGLAREFAGIDPVAVVLGDNIYQDRDFLAKAADGFAKGAHIFLKEVPEAALYEDLQGKKRAKYGIAEVRAGKVVSIEEKPERPKSNLAVTGAYIYDPRVFDVVRTLKPSWRGELEITDVNNYFINAGLMSYSVVSGDWTDAGSIETLHKASGFAASWGNA